MAEALAIDPRGLKRICTNCGTRFYDMNKRPITCPTCSTEFTGEIKVRTRRSRGAPVDDDGTATESAATDDMEAMEEEDTVIERDDEDEADETVIEADEDADDIDIDDNIDDIDDLEDDLDADEEDLGEPLNTDDDK